MSTGTLRRPEELPALLEPSPDPRRPRRWGRGVLLVLAGLGLGAAAYRMVFGLGAATNLNDQWPWGLWVWWDVLLGVALAGGGYSTAFLVRFMGRDKWEPLERSALLTSLIGYVLVCGGLVLDLGRWFNAWRPVVSWGYHSVMFELFWCVSMYTVIQAIEFTPIVLERYPAPRIGRVFDRIKVPVLVVGVVLPFLHQSALGSLFVINVGRMDARWWSMLLPVFFLMSSFFVGPAMVTLENVLGARSGRHDAPMPLLQDLLRVTASVMGLYLVLRVADLAWRGVLPDLFDGSTASLLLLLELVVGVAVPMFMLRSDRIRASRRGAVTAAALVVGGVALNRANVAFTAMGPPAGGSYVPSVLEILVTVGLVSAGILVYLFAVERLPVAPGSGHRGASAEDRRNTHSLHTGE